MKSALLFLFALLLSTPAAAQTSDAELRALIARVERALANPGTAANTDDAARALARAAEALERQAPEPVRVHRVHHWASGQLDACISLGTEALSSVMYPAPALERATATCSAAALDAGVLRIAYTTLSTNSYPQSAFASAVEIARNEALFHKSDVLAFAAAKYAETQYPRTALESAVRLTEQMPAGRFACLTRAFDTYAQTQYVASALDNAVQLCGDASTP